MSVVAVLFYLSVKVHFWSGSSIHFCFSVNAALGSDLRRGTDKYFILLFIQSCIDLTDSTERKQRYTNNNAVDFI